MKNGRPCLWLRGLIQWTVDAAAGFRRGRHSRRRLEPRAERASRNAALSAFSECSTVTCPWLARRLEGAWWLRSILRYLRMSGKARGGRGVRAACA